MRKTVKILNVPDYKDETGLWCREKTTTEGDVYIRKVTRSALLWANVSSRCKQPYWDKYQTYSGTENKFEGYQEFTEWCQNQFGYMSKDKSGRYWALDKDLVNPDSKCYSKENCIFVPNWVNTILISCNAVRGDYPIGVNIHKATGKFIGKCDNYIGLFDTPMEAHRAWQEKKLDILQDAIRHSDIENHTQLVEAVYNKAVKLRYQFDNNLETI
ncbi:MAG: hypothetical protein EOO06_01020 [Chitinophagaceae bacterium]|nr:MAG: hypothetical protein EOO06_01020 [Chitinophagaceae bacterium]